MSPSAQPLPTEILDLILRESHILLPTLAELIQTTPGLTSICVPLYLERNGIGNPEEACAFVMPQRHIEFDVLSALSLAYSVTKTRHFECHFVGRDGDLPALLAQFARLRTLLGQFTSLGEVVFNFNSQDKAYVGLSDGDIVAWANALGSLLSSVVERGCTSLEVNGLRQMCNVYDGMLVFPQRPLSLLESVIKAASMLFFNEPEQPKGDNTILQGPTWEYRREETRSTTHLRGQRAVILARLSDVAQNSSKLAHLTIGSKSLLCPPLLQWTYSILQSSPISTLVIHEVGFTCQEWSILSVLIPHAASSVRRLNISHIGHVSHGQITHFIESFAKLEHLSMDGVDLPWYTVLPGPGAHTTRFPFLEYFRVQVGWILSNMRFDAKDFPALRSLTVVFDEGLPKRHGEASALVALSQLGMELRFQVNMEIRVSSDIVSWMRRSVLPNGDPLVGFFRIVNGVKLAMNERLEYEHEPSIEGVKVVVEGWFGQFPALREIGIRTEADKLDIEIPRIHDFCKRALPEVGKRLQRIHINDQTV